MSTTRITVGDTTFEIDLVDGDGNTRTQADIDAIKAQLLASSDAKAAQARESEEATPAPTTSPPTQVAQ